MQSVHPACLSIGELLKNCQIERTRRSGPGGQHRNKVETAIVIRHMPSGVLAEASERRSQAENRQMAIRRLRVRLAVQVRGAIDNETPLSELWRNRAASGKVIVSADHDDFPSLLAEALDHLARTEFKTSEAAKRLGVSTTSLNHLIFKSPEAIALVNQQRAVRGLPRLKINA